MIERESTLSGNGRRLAGMIALACALFCVCTGWWSHGYQWALGDRLQAHNAGILDTSTQKAVALLVPIAAARGAVDVVEGSEMVVEFGDIVQPVLDYLDITWQVVLTTSMAMVASKQLLDGSIGIGPIFLGLALSFFIFRTALGFALKQQHAISLMLKRMASMCLLVALLVYAVLPLSISAAAWMSRHSTANITATYEQTFSDLAATFSMKEVSEAEGLRKKADGFKDKSEQLVRYVEAGGAKDLGRSVVFVTVAYTLDGIVFPILTLLFLCWFIRGSLYPALGLRSEKA